MGNTKYYFGLVSLISAFLIAFFSVQSYAQQEIDYENDPSGGTAINGGEGASPVGGASPADGSAVAATAVGGEHPATAATRTGAEITKLKQVMNLMCIQGYTYKATNPLQETQLRPIMNTSATNIGSDHKTYESQKTKCATAAQTARMACISVLSPHIKSALGALGIISGLAGTVMGVTNNCSKFGDAMKMVNLGLTAYNTACAAAMMLCNSSCKTTKVNLKKLQTDFEQLRAQKPNYSCTQEAYDSPKVQEANVSLEAVAKSCENYKLNLMAAGAGILSTVSQFAIAKKCEKKTENPTTAAAAGVDCTKQENFSKAECICRSAPNTAGCPGANNTNLGPSASSQQVTVGLDKDSKGFISGAGGGISHGDSQRSGSTDKNGFGTNGANSKLAAGGTGSQSNGFSGGGAGAAQNEKLNNAKALDTNISGGEDSGGGGGGAGGRGGGYSDSDDNSKFKAYIPGGAHDPNRGIASSYSAQVTGGGGKSNWEKISERYQTQKSSLIGQ